MQFNVAHLLKESVGTSQEETVDATLEPLEETRTDRVWGQLRLTRVNQGIWVSGALEATAGCTCSRCLQDVFTSVQFRLDDLYVPSIDISTGVPMPPQEDADPVFTIDDHHEVDITEAVRQSVIVALPMKPLCKEGCAGLCPQCGANLNKENCGHQGSRVDPRWLPLLKLAK